MRWWLFAVLGALVCVGYLLAPASLAAEGFFVAVGLLPLVAIVAGIRINRPAARTAWIFVASGSALWILGDVAYFSIDVRESEVPVPSYADVVYLAGYPALAVGMYLLVHRSWRHGGLGHVANSTIVVIALALPMWVFVVQPEITDVSIAEALVSIAYPAMDVFLLGLLVLFVGTAQWRNAAFRLLIAAVIVVLVADIAAHATVFDAVPTGQSLIDTGYLVCYVLIGAAALHPSARVLESPPDSNPTTGSNATVAASFSIPTVALVTAATLTAPAVMAVLLVRGEPVDSWGWGFVLCSTLLIFVVIIRVVELLKLLHRQSETDHLTGLYNRRGLERWMAGRPNRTAPLAIVFLDIDCFRDINDTFGYHVGDEVLRALARRFEDAIGTAGAISRVGSDQFVLLIDALPRDALSVANDLHASMLEPITLGNATLVIEASVGVATSSGSGRPPDSDKLAKQAFLALQAAKAAHRSVQLYDSSMDRDDTGQLLLLNELHTALERRELQLFYQPQVNLTTMKAASVEALVRWNHPERGLLEPNFFIPIAESTGLIKPLLDYVLTEALMQRQVWHAAGMDLTVSINISTRNLLDTTLVDQVEKTLAATGLSPELLTIEITETAFMADPQVAVQTLKDLRRLGTGLAIDDYGTGYSSLSYLQDLPVQQLKIDKTFVTDMTTAPAHKVIVRSTIDMALSLGLSVTAEGVEDLDTALTLKALGCHYAQGYYLGRPVPSDEVASAVSRVNDELSAYTSVT